MAETLSDEARKLEAAIKEHEQRLVGFTEAAKAKIDQVTTAMNDLRTMMETMLPPDGLVRGQAGSGEGHSQQLPKEGSGDGMVLMKKKKKKMIIIKCFHNQLLEVKKSTAVLCPEIKRLIKRRGDGAVIPVTSVGREVLARVLKYCKKHAKYASKNDPTAEQALKDWDWEFINAKRGHILRLMNAGSCLKVPGLEELGWQVAKDFKKPVIR